MRSTSPADNSDVVKSYFSFLEENPTGCESTVSFLGVDYQGVTKVLTNSQVGFKTSEKV